MNKGKKRFFFFSILSTLRWWWYFLWLFSFCVVHSVASFEYSVRDDDDDDNNDDEGDGINGNDIDEKFGLALSWSHQLMKNGRKIHISHLKIQNRELILYDFHMDFICSKYNGYSLACGLFRFLSFLIFVIVFQCKW